MGLTYPNHNYLYLYSKKYPLRRIKFDAPTAEPTEDWYDSMDLVGTKWSADQFVSKPGYGDLGLPGENWRLMVPLRRADHTKWEIHSALHDTYKLAVAPDPFAPSGYKVGVQKTTAHVWWHFNMFKDNTCYRISHNN